MRFKSIRDPGMSFELARKASCLCMATDPHGVELQLGRISAARKWHQNGTAWHVVLWRSTLTPEHTPSGHARQLSSALRSKRKRPERVGQQSQADTFTDQLRYPSV